MVSGSAVAETEPPFATPEDYRMAAKCARQRNQKAVRARREGNVKTAREHQAYADWLIARARMWRQAWEDANG
jgi:hypothetical protein